jgi:hypothetical protein
MKDETKKAFEAAVAKSRARETRAAQAQEKQIGARQQFEVKYRAAVENVIVPALKEIAQDILEPAGWTCDVRRAELHLQVTLDVYRGDMKAVGGRERPHISFSQDDASSQMNVYASTPSQGGPSGPYPVDAITIEAVQREALKFFQRLTGG